MDITLDKVINLSEPIGKMLITGKEGSGKTLLSTYIGIQKMLLGVRDCWKSYDEVDELNKIGYHFSKNFEHLVFSNFDINCAKTRIPFTKSYMVDPFKLGLYTEDYETVVHPPGALLIITEAQRPLNAYMWQYLRSTTRAYWETGRQAEINVILDTNQPNLIVNVVRSLCSKVIYLYKKVEPIMDGKHVVGHRLYVKEFSDYKYYDKYTENHKEDLVDRTYSLKIPMCLYDNFDSFQCRWLHYKGRVEENYILENFPEIKTIEDVERFVDNFGIVAPEGYYEIKNNKKKEKDDVGLFDKNLYEF